MIIRSGVASFNRGDDPTMDGGNGPRHYDRAIKFGTRFKRNPTVVTSITGLDVYNSANARISVDAQAIDDDGCNIHLHTWSDTKIWSLTVSWIAYGE